MSDLADDVLDVEQVAALLRCKKGKVEYLARNNVLPSIKVGRSRVFVRSLIVDALKKLIIEKSGVSAPAEPAVAEELEVKAKHEHLGVTRRVRPVVPNTHNPNLSCLPELPG